MLTTITEIAKHVKVERDAEGRHPHVAGVGGTRFDPPMPIEDIAVTDESGNRVTPRVAGEIRIPTDAEGLDITVWHATPEGARTGWMLNLGVAHLSQVDIVWI